ncbi:hypothetical protein BKP35_17210 [Anaerobacillus arseniciselenatis]|uniref:inosine/xanthosine triphosphatase n=1 Tax=Anaerobacillus arseniciselenatis TaxID=85682 RepID=A0A1S2LAC5_9BACI|nr:DUF84 family protein [Anaerobacillus arseniciselenatis]OIJ09274.1 hypothetical protein BKP35_17210 [Anaerobacillus arseniciselenatis]
MKIAIGSKNPTKIAAVKNVLGDGYEVISVDAPSLVSEQPFGDEETVNGALNRARACIEADDIDFAIGLEGGVQDSKYGLMVINWGALVDKNGNEFVASGARAPLPGEVALLVLEGNPLGKAIDLYTKRIGVSKKEGAMGIVTNSRINRDEMFTHVVKALVGQYEYKSAVSEYWRKITE